MNREHESRADVSPLTVPASPPGTPTTAGSEPRTEREDSREAIALLVATAKLPIYAWLNDMVDHVPSGAHGRALVAINDLARISSLFEESASQVVGLSADVTRLKAERAEERNEARRLTMGALALAQEMNVREAELRSALETTSAALFEFEVEAVLSIVRPGRVREWKQRLFELRLQLDGLFPDPSPAAIPAEGQT